MRRFLWVFTFPIVLVFILPMAFYSFVRFRLFGMSESGNGMVKLYRIKKGTQEYWETWQLGGGASEVHWGTLGDRGHSKTVTTDDALREMSAQREEGFEEIPFDNLYSLEVIYEIEGASGSELAKRHRLEDHLNELLGWTGLGHMDGGSIGSGTMESFVYVVDPEIAQRVISEDLKDTEFADYSAIRVHQPIAE